VEAAAVKLRPVLDAFGRTPATTDLARRLPARGDTLRLGGLAGSSGSVLAAWLANEHPQRQLVVVATTPGEA
jgi:transcription-repair coupling factor (superfamily II helicase)